jgi:alkylation response protein AidB-like acyl-CoA dehydrogenase
VAYYGALPDAMIVACLPVVRARAAGRVCRGTAAMSDAERLLPEPLIVDTAERVFARAAAGTAGAYAPARGFALDAWREVEAAGLASAWVSAALGGAGAAAVDGLAVARVAGRHAIALPVAETLLAGWLLAEAGIGVPEGPLAVVIDARAAPGAAADAAAARRLGALLRAQQMAGALERILEISLDYARNRVQFGRPIARFQAVQQELARLAGECAAAAAAAGAGASALARHGLAHEIAARAAAAAKIRVGQAAGAGAAIAHQVHGAMGFSQEYVLQRYTRQLWSWRDDFGAETEWAQWLGQRVCAAGAEGLWPELTRA